MSVYYLFFYFFIFSLPIAGIALTIINHRNFYFRMIINSFAMRYNLLYVTVAYNDLNVNNLSLNIYTFFQSYITEFILLLSNFIRFFFVL